VLHEWSVSGECTFARDIGADVEAIFVGRTPALTQIGRAVLVVT
jgi:hypothetical protein